MDFTPDFGWYYRSSNDRAPAWTSVEFFYDFMTGNPAFVAENQGIGPFGREVRAREIELGDVIQLADEEGDYYHTLIITGFEPNDILVCAHTDDSLNRPLSTYNFASLRFIHIDGVRVEIADDACYESLLDGIAIVVNDPNAPENETPPPDDSTSSTPTTHHPPLREA